MTSTAAKLDVTPAEPVAPPPAAVRLLVLARAAVTGGVTRSELVRDLAPLLSSRLSPSAIRELANTIADALVAEGLLADTRNRLEASSAGLAQASSALGLAATPKDWPTIRDGRLLAHALGFDGLSAAKVKALLRPDGLRAAVLARAYDFPAGVRATPAKVRAKLAVVALERAFGDRIKGELGAGDGMTAKTSRLLAAQLSRKPRDFGTDSRLLAALAAEAAGAVQSDVDSLRLAILRRWLGQSLEATGVVPRPAPQPDRPRGPVSATAAPPPQSVAPPKPAAATRPDLPGFALAVMKAARLRAEGWPGNRKALISRVWQTISVAHPEWGLSEIEFKSMLAEAHRTGHIVLANADLKDKDNLKDLQSSAVSYKNTVWHLVRVED